MDTAEARAREEGRRSETVYDGFLSYSHAADDLLAPRLQAGLQRFAKPWWKRRALRIFRDEASLSANPHLWSSITDALDQSGWFVLLLSSDAASSEWVNREVEYWLDHKDPQRIIPVLTEGEFAWGDGDIMSDAAPPALEGAFSDEPRWVDLRFAGSEEQLVLKNPRFSAAVADIASAIRGVPKDELESEEVKQHRRTIRTAWAAGIALLLLVLLAAGAAILAIGQRSEAVENERVAQARELAAASVANLQVDPERSLLLALEAARMTFEQEGTVLREATEALHAALLASRLEATLPDSGRGAFTPDGQLFVAGDPATPATFGPAGAGPIAAFDDRPRLVAVDADGRATIWDAVSWERLGECCDHIPGTDLGITGRSRGVSYVVLSGDGQLAATTGPDDRVKVWDIATGALRFEVGHLAVFSAALSPNGALVAATSSRGQVNVWDVTAEERLAALPRLPSGTAGIAFSPDGGLLAVGVGDGTARVYEVGTWNERTLLEHESPVWDVAFHPAGGRLLTAGDDSTAVLWDLVTGERLRTFRGHSAAVGGVDFSPDGGEIATGSTDGSARVWDAETGDVLIELAVGGATDYVTFGPDGSHLATAQTDGTAKIWNVSTQGGGEVLALSGRGPVLSLAFDGHHRLATLEAEMGDLRIIEVPAGRELLLLSGVGQAGRIAFNSDGSLLGASGPEETVIIWDSQTGEERLTLEGHEATVLSVGFSSDNQWIVTTGGEGAVRLWDAVTGEERLSGAALEGKLTRPPYVVHRLDRPVFTAQFSPDSQLVLSAGADGVAQLSELPVGRARRRFEHPAPVSAAALSPDGKLVATATADGTATIWDADTVVKLHLLAVSAAQVSDVEFSPDGSRVATGSADGTVKLWDTTTGEELLGLKPHSAGVTDLDFSHDGLYLASSGVDGTVQVLLLDVGQLVELAQSRVTRSLTEVECQRYLHLQACPAGG